MGKKMRGEMTKRAHKERKGRNYHGREKSRVREE